MGTKKESILETTETRMLRRINGVALRNRERCDEIMKSVRVENITLEARTHWADG